MGEQNIIDTIFAIMATCRLNYTHVATAVGVSASTVRLALLTRTLPERRQARVAIQAFAERNADAARRSDIRFCD
jgi:hypothetical protein